jgi:hypothetical protein
LDRGGDYTIVVYTITPPAKGFRFDIEGGDEEEPVGMKWQQVLVKEFKFLSETDMPNDRLREIADWFGFKYIELLIQRTFEGEA